MARSLKKSTIVFFIILGISCTAVICVSCAILINQNQVRDEDKMMYTISEVKVIRTLKGDINTGDIIQVKQLGDGKKILDKTIVENGGYYVKGNEKIFFLMSFKEFGVPYSVLNPIQGQIAFENDIIVKNENNPLFVDVNEKREKNPDMKRITPGVFLLHFCYIQLFRVDRTQ